MKKSVKKEGILQQILQIDPTCLDEEVDKAVEFSLAPQNILYVSTSFFKPGLPLVHIPKMFPPLWFLNEYHEWIHKELCTTPFGAVIAALDTLSADLFRYMFVRKPKDWRTYVSWILNLEYKRRKLHEKWLLTQEGSATYSQIHNLSPPLSRCVESFQEWIDRELTTEEKNRIKEIMIKGKDFILDKVRKKKCEFPYWRGYILSRKIVRRFGLGNLLTAAGYACYIDFWNVDIVGSSLTKFNELIAKTAYTPDKRFECIGKIPKRSIPDKFEEKEPEEFAEFLKDYFAFPIFPKKITFQDLFNKILLHPRLPKQYRKYIGEKMPKIDTESIQKWKELEEKGVHEKLLSPFIDSDGKITTVHRDFKIERNLEVALLAIIKRDNFVKWIVNESRNLSRVKKVMKKIVNQQVSSADSIWNLLRGRVLKDCDFCFGGQEFDNQIFHCPLSQAYICLNCCSRLCLIPCQNFKKYKNWLTKIKRKLVSLRPVDLSWFSVAT